jgi:hypothetical protein
MELDPRLHKYIHKHNQKATQNNKETSIKLYLFVIFVYLPVTLTPRSNAWIHGRLPFGVAGSNPAKVIDGFFLL